MARMRFTCLLLVLLFTAWHHSIAHAHQDGREAEEIHVVSTGKGLLDGERVEAAAMNKRMLGRKRAMDGVMRLEKVNANGAIVETSKISGSNKFAGSCDKNMIGVSNDKCKEVVSHFPGDVDVAGFVAFDADYHAPRHHPPKNN